MKFGIIMKKMQHITKKSIAMILMCSLSCSSLSVSAAELSAPSANSTQDNESTSLQEDTIETSLQTSLATSDYTENVQQKTVITDRIVHISPMPDKLTLAFAGDMNLDENWCTTLLLNKQPNGIYDCISPELIAEMNRADIFMPNNEFTYSERGKKLAGKAWTFRAHPSRVSVMQQLGTDIVLLANNHCYDYGPDSLYDTLDTLQNAQIPYVGAGRNLSEAVQPYFFQYDGLLIAYVAASQAEKFKMTPQATDTTPGILRCYDMSLYLEVIRNAAQVADIVIANIHWGTEGSNKAEQYQRDLAYAMIDAGADAVVGSHPHVLQGFEYYQGKPIMYSLGNFWFNAITMYTCLYELEIDTASKTISGVKFIPATQTGCRTIYASAATEQRKIMDFEQKLSFGVTIDDNGYVLPAQ